MTQCVYLAQLQNDTVRHFGTVCHFGTEGLFDTVTKFLSFIFFLIFFRILSKKKILAFCSYSIKFLSPFYIKPEILNFVI